MDTKNKKIKIVVAMSGGVDSSVAAALLKRENFNVVGVFMKFWVPAGATQINTDTKTDLHRYNRCCTPESEKRARRVAKILGIPFYVLNFEKEFKKRVVDYFLKEQKAGRTPNPCVVCNKEIKFGLLLEKALKLRADFIATGHYAKIKKRFVNSQQIRYSLMSAKDKNKDQSYFLWQLSQKQLSRVLFPISDFTRKKVEEMAKKFKLPFSGIKKSFEVCFIQTTVNDFLRKYVKNKPGKIVDKQGNIIGEHEGLWFYTIGQRKGIEINRGQTPVRLQGSDPCKTAKILSGKPFYVLDKDIKKNLLIITQNEKDLYKKELIAKNVNWISGTKPKLPIKVIAKIRYRSQVAPAIVYKIQNTPHQSKHGTGQAIYKIQFSQPQRAITPGQSVVFYAPVRSSGAKEGKEEELIGGGIIQ